MATWEDTWKIWLHGKLNDIAHINFDRKAWYQTDKFTRAWVWTCPKEHI